MFVTVTKIKRSHLECHRQSRLFQNINTAGFYGNMTYGMLRWASTSLVLCAYEQNLMLYKRSNPFVWGGNSLPVRIAASEMLLNEPYLLFFFDPALFSLYCLIPESPENISGIFRWIWVFPSTARDTCTALILMCDINVPGSEHILRTFHMST